MYEILSKAKNLLVLQWCFFFIETFFELIYFVQKCHLTTTDQKSHVDEY